MKKGFTQNMQHYLGIFLEVVLLCLVDALMFLQFLTGILASPENTEPVVPITSPTQIIEPTVTQTVSDANLPTQIRVTSTEGLVPTEKNPTSTTSPTKTPEVVPLEVCRTDTKSLCILFFAESNRSLIITLRQEENFVGDYGMNIDSSQYSCKVSGDNPKRLWCTGEMQPTNVSLPAQFYSYLPDILIASGNIVIPPLESATPAPQVQPIPPTQYP